jgi:hypothetical protein
MVWRENLPHPVFFAKNNLNDGRSEKEMSMQRKLKVEHRGDFYERKTYPLLRLQGKWLWQAGFLPDSYVNLTIEQGRIVIVPQKATEKGPIPAIKHNKL